MDLDKKEEAKRIKLAQKLEREEKAKAKKAEANRKRLLLEAKRASKPGECLKRMTVNIDNSLTSTPHGRKIIGLLSEKDQKYEILQLPHPNLITFWREVTSVVINNDGQHELEKKDEPEEKVLLVFSSEDFIPLIMASVAGHSNQNLKSFVQSLSRKLEGRNISVIVQGLQKALKKGRRDFSRVDMEEVLLDLQITMECNFVFTESDEETAQHVFHYLKAVAEAPFKIEKNQNVMNMHIDNSSTVRMDKDGVGVTQAWRNIIQIFKNVSADQANAIMSNYPTPSSLLLAYQKCTEKEGQKLLEDINVRRGYGVLESNRRIGIELSKRMYTLFTSLDPGIVLK